MAGQGAVPGERCCAIIRFEDRRPDSERSEPNAAARLNVPSDCRTFNRRESEEQAASKKGRYKIDLMPVGNGLVLRWGVVGWT